MIIDAHVHLPVVDGCISLQKKKERILHEMTKNQVRKCIVISDSDITSPIGTVDECVELFKDEKNPQGKDSNYCKRYHSGREGRDIKR